jgi:hypothetical protein
MLLHYTNRNISAQRSTRAYISSFARTFLCKVQLGRERISKICSMLTTTQKSGPRSSGNAFWPTYVQMAESTICLHCRHASPHSDSPHEFQHFAFSRAPSWAAMGRIGKCITDSRIKGKNLSEAKRGSVFNIDLHGLARLDAWCPEFHAAHFLSSITYERAREGIKPPKSGPRRTRMGPGILSSYGWYMWPVHGRMTDGTVDRDGCLLRVLKKTHVASSPSAPRLSSHSYRAK